MYRAFRAGKILVCSTFRPHHLVADLADLKKALPSVMSTVLPFLLVLLNLPPFSCEERLFDTVLCLEGHHFGEGSLVQQLVILAVILFIFSSFLKFANF